VKCGTYRRDSSRRLLKARSETPRYTTISPLTNLKKILINIVLVVIGLIIGSCQKDLPNQPKQNQLPTTRLFLAADTTLRETSSRQHLHWYGEDPDGIVIGYLLASGAYRLNGQLPQPDTTTYTWITKNDSIVALPLLTARDSFVVIVRAVDNTFEKGSLPEGARLRMIPQPYWDKNLNGQYDGADIALPSLSTAIDPKGAIQLLPLRNTPPKVFFSVNPFDSTIIQQPETTFTVATFSWYGTDVDGDQTIASYRIALNDTLTPERWFTVSGAVNLVTLIVPRSVSDNATGEVEAEVYTGKFPNMQFRRKIPGLRLNDVNRFFLQAKDVAGEYSNPVSLPSVGKRWYVAKPKSRMLLVMDYNQLDRVAANSIFRSALKESLPGKQFDNFDTLNLAWNLSAADKQNQLANQRYGANVPNHMNPAFIHTLKLFDVVFWFSDLYPSYLPAQIGLFNYTLTGGKVIFSTTFPANISFPDVRAMNDFAPIDSVSTDVNSTTTLHTNADSRMRAGTKVFPLVSGFPQLTFDSTQSIHNFNWRRVYKRADAQYLYRVDSSKFYETPPTFRYAGSPEIACIDNNKSFVIMALPLHRLNGGKNLPAFFKRVIVDEFGLN